MRKCACDDGLPRVHLNTTARGKGDKESASLTYRFPVIVRLIAVTYVVEEHADRPGEDEKL